MVLVRSAIMLLLLAAGISFALYAGTGNPKYKRFGILVLKWTLIAALGFFVVLFADRWFAG
jgi:hypothetical protein